MQYLALTLPGGKSVAAPGGIPTGGIDKASKIIANSITILLIVTTILSLIFLIIGGIQWIQSGGDKQKVSAARARITYAIIGLVVALASFFIINVIGFLFKVNLTTIG